MRLTKENIQNIDKSKYNELPKEQQELVIKILQEFRDNDGFSKTLDDIWMADYEEIPIDVVTFISDERYLGKSTRRGTSIYPFWMKEYENIFNDDNGYIEVVLTGAIGIGKTRTAVVCLCYLLYLIMCLKNPQEFFKFNEGDEITIAFCNITVELAEGVAYKTMHEYLLNSPWFMERGVVTGKKELRYNPPKHITLSFGSKAGHFLGKQIYAALMDECDFTRASLKGADVLTAQSGVMDTYTQIKERINSRFIVGGKQYGRMFLVSSKKSEHDFLESYVRKLQGTPEGEHMLVVDEPQWVVKPPNTYCGKKFRVAVGNKLLTSQIIPDKALDEDITALKNQGYRIIEVPVEMKQSFVLNINTALMNLAGISVIGTTSYFNYALFSRCYIPNAIKPFHQDILDIGLHDDKQIIDYFIPDRIPEELKSMPQFIHIDTSLKGDITGISDTAITGKKKSIQYSGANEVVTQERCYRHLFTIGIKAPQGDEISLEKTRQFIYALKRLGFNIKRISIDGFQSADTRQILDTNGFNATIISMDKLKDGDQPGYSTTRSAMNDGRVGMIQYDKLEEELVRLQKDNTTGKIDHPIDGCFTDDTKILLVDGRTLTIKELLIEQQYKTNYVYTVNEVTKHIEPKPIKKVFKTKYVKELVKVTLDNNEVIYCTPNHRFMLRNGEYEEIQNIPIGTSLMPLYTRICTSSSYKGYKQYYEPFKQKWYFEHSRFCKNLVSKKGYVVHHCNFNKLDNCTSNLKCITISEHTRIHNCITKDYTSVSKSVKEWHSSNKNTFSYKLRSDNCRRSMYNYYNSKIENYILGKQLKQDRIKEIENTFNIKWDNLSLSDKNKYGNKFSRYKDKSILERTSSTLSLRHKQGCFDNAHKLMHNKRWVTNGIDTKYIDITKESLPDGYRFGRTLTKHNLNNLEYKNHKLLNIEFISKGCAVYDLEIADNHNFALAAGVFVHNSKDLCDSFAGSIYNAATYDEEDSFDLELMDCADDINLDLDSIIEEQYNLTQQLMNQNSKPNNSNHTSNKPTNKEPQLESLLDGLNTTPNTKPNNINNYPSSFSSDFIVW